MECTSFLIQCKFIRYSSTDKQEYENVVYCHDALVCKAQEVENPTYIQQKLAVGNQKSEDNCEYQCLDQLSNPCDHTDSVNNFDQIHSNEYTQIASSMTKEASMLESAKGEPPICEIPHGVHYESIYSLPGFDEVVENCNYHNPSSVKECSANHNQEEHENQEQNKIMPEYAVVNMTERFVRIKDTLPTKRSAVTSDVTEPEQCTETQESSSFPVYASVVQETQLEEKMITALYPGEKDVCMSQKDYPCSIYSDLSVAK